MKKNPKLSSGSPYLGLTKGRLMDWGNWCQCTLERGLDYQSVSLLELMRQSCGDVISSTKKKLASDNPKAEEIENLVLKLGQIDAQKARVLYIQYVSQKTQREKAKIAGYSVGHYYEILQQAERCIDQWLSGKADYHTY